MQRRTERETSPSRAFSSKHAGPQTGHRSALQLERGRTQDGQGQVRRWREVKSSRSRFRKPRGFAQVSPAVWARPSPCAQCEAPASGTFPRRPPPPPPSALQVTRWQTSGQLAGCWSEGRAWCQVTASVHKPSYSGTLACEFPFLVEDENQNPRSAC